MHPRTTRALAAAIALALASAAAAGAAPAQTPALVGTVQDTAGAPLPNAQVVISELNRGVTTGGAGDFVFRGLPAGRYHLDGLLIGYAPSHTEIVIPAAGPDARVTVTMRRTALRIATVQVTATPTGTDPLNITQSTVELSGRELSRALGASVAQTLSQEPGMATRFAGPAASAPVIRGLQGERVLVLQDGQRAADLSAISPDHGVTVDPLAASRIEVVRGPASLLYGNNALGGVVNVISNDIPSNIPSHIEGYLALQGETVNPGGALSGSANIPLGSSLALNLRAGFRDLGDVRQGGGARLASSASRNWNGVAAIGRVGSRVSGGVGYRGYRFDYGLPAAADEEEGGVTLEGARHEAIGRADVTLGERGFTYMRLDGSAQFYEHDEIEPSGEVGTTFRLATQTVNATSRTRFGALQGAMGVSGLFRDFSPIGEEALTPSASSRSSGLFVFQELYLGDPEGESEDYLPRLQLGARYDASRVETEASERFGAARSRDFGDVSGSVGLNVPFGRGRSVGVSAARAVRAPTVEELFSDGFHAAVGAFDRGDPGLRPEINQGFDAVLRAQSERVTMQVAGFLNRIDRYIAPALLGDTTIVVEHDGGVEELTVPLNAFAQQDATLRGLEGMVETTVNGRWVVGAMGDFVRGRFADGAPIPFMPQARVGGSLRWSDRRWSAGAAARHAFRQDRAGERAAANETVAGSYTLVNLDLGLLLVGGRRAHSITLRVDNLLDEEYREATSRIKRYALNPGRNVAVVYRLLY